MAQEKDLETALSPVIADHGMELVDLEFRAEPGGWVLRLFVDQQGGVTIGDCARVSRDCAAVLDGENLIDRSYRLEVSSPGVERRLRKREHFECYVGETVRLVLREPIGGRRRLTGRLTAVTAEFIEVGCDETEVLSVPYEAIKQANLKVF